MDNREKMFGNMDNREKMFGNMEKSKENAWEYGKIERKCWGTWKNRKKMLGNMEKCKEYAGEYGNKKEIKDLCTKQCWKFPCFTTVHASYSKK